jgi:hypothetical protein
MAWRPGKVWLMLGLGGITMTIADAAYAVQHARGTATASHYDFLWAAGALLIARAAWVDTPVSHEHRQLHGLKAVALPLAAQLLAVALQLCIVLIPSFDTQTHRIVVLAVLIIATVQVVIARPRLERADREAA